LIYFKSANRSAIILKQINSNKSVSASRTRVKKLGVFVKSAKRTAINIHFLKLNTVISAKRTAKISVFNAFSYKNASPNGSSFSNRFHQIKVFNVKLRKTVSVLVRYGSRFYEKLAFKTAKREHLIRGRVRAFKQKSPKTVTKVRYAVRSTKTVPRGKR
jgi:hypothetical protein